MTITTSNQTGTVNGPGTMNRPKVLVLTGVENAGKTATAEALAAKTGWPLIPEFARTHPDVLGAAVTRSTLHALHALWQEAVTTLKTDAPWIICDTGPLVLELWSEEVFGKGLGSADQAFEPSEGVALFVLCETLEHWHPDPLRNLPRHADRKALEEKYLERLQGLAIDGTSHIQLPGTWALKSRVEHVLNAASHMIS